MFRRKVFLVRRVRRRSDDQRIIIVVHHGRHRLPVQQEAIVLIIHLARISVVGVTRGGLQVARPPTGAVILVDFILLPK